MATEADAWSTLLDTYRQAAVQTLSCHFCADNRCSACNQVWPCTAACAAEFTLDLD
ncbi:hypothetical protein N8J89_30715 [Crossiella sp. CA-258035]|uniref:hypothetical protein n=1 Tax=Crossiella sp. CA-258035 TaxID=2981138 RepID=UPI0024BD2B83|nr:hypothetical protein [Crossiella sp. CA-258035]WHT17473.1 hypothetical protein N8J89_30715 [Crossiella sp. CA-258035]